MLKYLYLNWVCLSAIEGFWIRVDFLLEGDPICKSSLVDFAFKPYSLFLLPLQKNTGPEMINKKLEFP